MLRSRRQWVRLLYRVNRAKLWIRSFGAVFRGYSNYLRPGGRAYERHIKQEVEQYEHVHGDSHNELLIERVPASWFDMRGRVARRIRERPNYNLERGLDRAILDWIWELDCDYLDTGGLKPETLLGIYHPTP